MEGGGRREKKQEALRVEDTPLRAEQPGCFTILGNPLCCLAARSWGCLVTSSGFISKDTTTAGTEVDKNNPGSNSTRKSCKWCIFAAYVQHRWPPSMKCDASCRQICVLVDIYYFHWSLIFQNILHGATAVIQTHLHWDVWQSPASPCNSDTALLLPKTTPALS